MYVSVDTPTYTGQTLQFFLDLLRGEHNLGADDQLYVVFDEIQYLADWERHLKVLVDRQPNVRFVASGSAAAALKLASTESGAGRFTDFMLPPLTFSEYLTFVNRIDLVGEPDRETRIPTISDIDALNAEFVNYINYGGYPEAVMSEEVRLDAARFIKSDIIEKVLLRDLPQLYGITNIQELNRLFTSLAYQSGQEISLENLSQTSGISKPTIARYIEYLEAAFLVFRVRRIDDNCKVFLRERSFKIYLTNPSMRSALFSPIDSHKPAFGHLVETAIFSQWFHSLEFGKLHYARWSRSGKAKTRHGTHAEIDLVLLSDDVQPEWVAEVKWSDSAHKKAENWQAIYDIIQKKPRIRGGIFTSRTVSSVTYIEGRRFRIIPSAAYCYIVGRNTARARGSMRARAA